MWSSWVKRGYNSSYVYCQAKGWSKIVKKNFLSDFERGFWNGMMEGGENRITSKRRFWSWSVFLLLEYWLHLYLKWLLELFFFFLFFFFLFFSICFLSFSSFLSMLRLLGVLIIFEEKIHNFKNFFSNEMVWS
jgi:hypothetical protein